MSSFLISACLIVKNEERFLAQCLRSIQPLVDEIVVVDTGSRDQTRQIAAEFGARLFDFKWTGDFAAARNESLRHAQGQWILIVDADECVRPFDPSKLRRMLRASSNAAYEVVYHIRPGYTPVMELRLFRNHPGIRFKSAIHENIWDSLERIGGTVEQCRLTFDHFGYEGDQRAKHKRDIPLLERSLRQNPRQVFHWLHLALAYEGLGKMALAGKTWRRAVATLRRKRRRPGSGGLAYAGLLRFQLDRVRGPRSVERLEILADEAVRYFPANIDLHWLRGRIQMMANKYEAAIPSFQAAISYGKGNARLQSAGFDKRTTGVLAYESLAACYFKMGQYGRAAHYFRLAENEEPENSELRIKKMVCERLRGQRRRP